ncbi:hypothetical protein AUEXF2481DRAFT_127232 [Aureobasidium subglaciale EXF-2481]|uniref:Uncharacterized protein n=1 Tax=Aureobasidium subglaciale (strain EXF-2481) TaxID=1043005 RepID=A0A074YVU8_AURSE|nr:uncharacterized protein AUEXF2481DRAFT_127232 [Aureobasidium subglaciale EXF-2481]KER00275.1 hypothetical protein AUEXF2481DRAFT_127232 [Aureobasidium subglaciale EXF-2481]
MTSICQSNGNARARTSLAHSTISLCTPRSPQSTVNANKWYHCCQDDTPSTLRRSTSAQAMQCEQVLQKEFVLHCPLSSRRGHRCLPSKMFRRHPLKPFLLLTSGTTALAASPESSSQVPLQRDATYALLSGGPGVKRAVTRHSDFLDCTSLRGEPVGSRQNDESRRTSRRC